MKSIEDIKEEEFNIGRCWKKMRIEQIIREKLIDIDSHPILKCYPCDGFNYNCDAYEVTKK